MCKNCDLREQRHQLTWFCSSLSVGIRPHLYLYVSHLIFIGLFDFVVEKLYKVVRIWVFTVANVHLVACLGLTRTSKDDEVDIIFLIPAILPCVVDVQMMIIVSARGVMRKIVSVFPIALKNGDLHPLLRDNRPPPPLMGSIGYLILMKRGKPK